MIDANMCMMHGYARPLGATMAKRSKLLLLFVELALASSHPFFFNTFVACLGSGQETNMLALECQQMPGDHRMAHKGVVFHKLRYYFLYS